MTWEVQQEDLSTLAVLMREDVQLTNSPGAAVSTAVGNAIAGGISVALAENGELAWVHKAAKPGSAVMAVRKAPSEGSAWAWGRRGQSNMGYGQLKGIMLLHIAARCSYANASSYWLLLPEPVGPLQRGASSMAQTLNQPFCCCCDFVYVVHCAAAVCAVHPYLAVARWCCVQVGPILETTLMKGASCTALCTVLAVNPDMLP